MRNSNALSHCPNTITSQWLQVEDAMFKKKKKSFEGDHVAYLRIQPCSPLLCSPLSQGAVREWCGLNVCAAPGYEHRVSHCAWCLPVTETRFFSAWRSSVSVAGGTADLHTAWELVFSPAWRMESPWYPGKETPGSEVITLMLKWAVITWSDCL